MAHPATSPLPILLVLPTDRQEPTPHGLIGGGRLQAELLCAEVAACVAAVGHRLHTVPRSARWAEQVPSVGMGPPALILWGLAPGEDAPPPSPRPAPAPVIPVVLGPGSPGGALGLPGDSRRLCSALARAARSGAVASAGGTPVPGRAPAPEGLAAPDGLLSPDGFTTQEGDSIAGRVVVLLHDGEGPDGDDRWPGLGWALTLMWAGPGRGILMDLRGHGSGLSARMRDLTSPGGSPLGWYDPGPAPVPGPALMARLPALGGVRWWGWAARAGRDGPGGADGARAHGALWAARDECIRTAAESSAWTVLDAGRDAGLTREAAAAGIPVVRCTDRPGTDATDPGPRPDVVVRAQEGPAGAEARSRGVGTDGAVSFRAADWAGASVASWTRAARRASGRRVAAEIALRLDRMGATWPGEALP